jgi:hypothetical protein
LEAEADWPSEQRRRPADLEGKKRRREKRLDIALNKNGMDFTIISRQAEFMRHA